jgi:hypothetical protein
LAVHRLVLRKIPQAFIPGKDGAAFIGGKFSHDNTEQGRFPCPVDSNDSGFVLVFYMKGNILQYFFFMKCFADVLA